MWHFTFYLIFHSQLFLFYFVFFPFFKILLCLHFSFKFVFVLFLFHLCCNINFVLLCLNFTFDLTFILHFELYIDSKKKGHGPRVSIGWPTEAIGKKIEWHRPMEAITTSAIPPCNLGLSLCV